MQTKQPKSDSKRASIPKEAGYIQIHKLQQDVVALTQRNKTKYLQILWHDPNYNILFYQPNDMLKTEKAFKKELLLKQMDKLMDQRTIFDKKLAQLNFIKETQCQDQSKSLCKELNSYQLLRTVWAKHQKVAMQAINSFDRLESLNWTIGMIKNTVISMKQKQQQSIPSISSEAQVINSKNYQKLSLEYNRSLMINQQLQKEIFSLKEKIQSQNEVQRELEQSLNEKQKQIKHLKKSKDLIEVNHKFIVGQLEQQLFLVKNKVQKLQKWKVNLQKNSIENVEKYFKIYFDIFDQSQSIEEKYLKTTSKTLTDIVEYFAQNNSVLASTLEPSNHSDFLNTSSALDQQNCGVIMIPTLSFTEPNEESSTRKKMPTDRPLKSRNFDVQKFVGNKLGNLKFSKVPQIPAFNDETSKKFVRKNSALNSSRKIQPQYSDRYFEQVSNSKN